MLFVLLKTHISRVLDYCQLVDFTRHRNTEFILLYVSDILGFFLLEKGSPAFIESIKVHLLL
uniref:Uncharacterized protein n=1 Tax=Arundo donax TaxID=35708 RepID=A0A0A9CDU8_ARUDO